MSYFIPSSARGPLHRLLDRALGDAKLTRIVLVQHVGRGATAQFPQRHTWTREELDEGAYDSETIIEECEEEHCKTGKYELRYYSVEDDPDSPGKERERKNPVKKKAFGVSPERGRTRSGSKGSDAASEKMAASMAGLVDKMGERFMGALEHSASNQEVFLKMMQDQHDKEIEGSSELMGEYMDVVEEKHEIELEMAQRDSGMFGLPPAQGLALIEKFGPAGAEVLGEVTGLIRAFRRRVDPTSIPPRTED